jgi:hypothetical protein
MLRFLLLIPAIVLLAVSADGLVRVFQGQRVVTTTCDEVARAGASPRVRITGCAIDIAGAAYRESGGRIVELFFPARPAGRTAAAPIVAAVHEPEALTMAQPIRGAPTAAAEGTLRQVADLLQLSNAIDGVARVSLVERLRTRRVLSGLRDAVAADAAVIDVNGTRDLVTPALALAGGLLLAALPWLVRSRRRVPVAVQQPPAASDQPDAAATKPDPIAGSPPSRAPEPVPQVEPPPEAGAAPAAAPQPSRVSVLLPRLLLLNVDVMSGPEAVENAPPLGMRHEVVKILCGVVPDLESTGGDNAIARPDGSLRFELGWIDPVVTVVVEAHGEAGVALVKEVLLMTGWRAFAPKTGLFVTTDDLEALAALAESR